MQKWWHCSPLLTQEVYMTTVREKMRDGNAHPFSKEEVLVMRILPLVEDDEELSGFLCRIVEEVSILRALVKRDLQDRIRLNTDWKRDLGNLAKQLEVNRDLLNRVLKPILKEILEENFDLEIS